MKTRKTTSAPKVGSSALVRAFRVDVADWPEAAGIVRTTSPSKAKFAMWRGAQDAGYDLPFSRFKARRAPEYDGKTSLIAGRNYDLEYATAADSPNATGEARADSAASPHNKTL
jgi:hypothetical protein